MQIEWHKDLELGINQIDAQHRQLVNIINHLDFSKKKSDAQVIRNVFLGLQKYTHQHFTFEENLMCSHDFSGFDMHRLCHIDFTDKIESCYENFLHNEPFAVNKALEYLNDWLISHILIEDSKYAEILLPVKTNSVSSSRLPF
jgi:hemerythrin